MAVLPLSGVMVGLRCAALVVTSQSGAATVARITVVDGAMGMVLVR